MQALEGVEVLELGLGAELGLAPAAQRHVTVAAHGTVLHRAVGDAEREEDAAQLLHEEARLLGRAQIRLGHELDQRGTATVVVDERLRGRGDAALLAAQMRHLGGILLHVDAQDADGHRVGTVVVTLGQLEVRGIVARHMSGRTRRAALGHLGGHAGGEAHGVGTRGSQALRLGLAERTRRTLGGTAPRDLQIQMPVHAEGDGALRGLEVLGHIRIEVVLPVEHAVLHDLAVRSQARFHDGADSLAVGHRQRAGQAQAHRAHVGVRLVLMAELAATKHLGVERGELGMDLETDHGLPVLQDLGELLHARSPPFPAKPGATESAGAPSAPANPRSTARANMSRSRSLKAGPCSCTETGS